MDKYIDLVLCQHHPNEKPYLFRAPFATGLKEGKTVIVETCRGDKIAKVVATQSVRVDSEEYKFAILAAGATELKRVIFSANPIFSLADEEYFNGIKEV